MALQITLKAREKMIIGGAVITNGNMKCELRIENNVPILRSKDIMKEKDATTLCRRIYFVIQLIYIDGKNILIHHNAYWELIRKLVYEEPDIIFLVDQISEEIVCGRYYQALKLSKKLIEYEQENVNNVCKSVVGI